MYIQRHEFFRRPTGEDASRQLNLLVQKIKNLGADGLSPDERWELMRRRYEVPEDVRDQIEGRLSVYYGIPTPRTIIGRYDSIEELNAEVMLDFFGLNIPQVRREHDAVDWKPIAESVKSSAFLAPKFPSFVESCIVAAARHHALSTVKEKLALAPAIFDMSDEDLDEISAANRYTRLGFVNATVREVSSILQAIDWNKLPCLLLFVEKEEYRVQDKVDTMFWNFQTTQQLIANTRITSSAFSALLHSHNSLSYLDVVQLLERVEN